MRIYLSNFIPIRLETTERWSSLKTRAQQQQQQQQQQEFNKKKKEQQQEYEWRYSISSTRSKK